MSVSPTSVTQNWAPFSFKDDAKSVVEWFTNLVGPTLKGRPACKPTMTAVIPIVIDELKQVMAATDEPSTWAFIDLGCGQGAMLEPMRDAMVDDTPIFQHVAGVELDKGTHRAAVAAHSGDPAIEIVCGDMFPFVETICAGSTIYGGRAAFYIYEPLWMANLPQQKVDSLYSGLLANVAKHPGSIICYCSADQYRELSTELLEKAGLELKRTAPVAQNGAFNKLKGRYNTLELWQVPEDRSRPKGSPPKRVRRK